MSMSEMETAEQQNALKDAMARAKEIAAKLKQNVPLEGSFDGSSAEPGRKRRFTDNIDINDPKVIAQQVANSLVQRAGLGPMLVEEITIPNKIVGIVIGRGGEMINKLQSESGAKVQVAPDPPPEMSMMVHDRQITITGPAEAVNKAKALISEIQSAGKVPDHLQVGTAPGEFSIEMSISKQKVGLIIGKGGETIKNLQERAGCKMVLFQDGVYSNATEKPLRISGEQNAVMFGKQLVEDLLVSRELGQRQQFNGSGGPGGPRPPWLDGGQGPGGPGGPGGPRHSGPRSFGNRQSTPQPGHRDMIIEVPANRAGLVIGKGGENIKMIKNETNISIQIDRSVPEISPFRIFRVQGTDEMIQKALVIIREKTNDTSITAKDESGNEPAAAPFGQSPWGAPGSSPWTPQPHENLQQWGGGQPQQQQQQPDWGRQQQQQQQPGAWNQQSQQPRQDGGQAWNQQHQPWNSHQQQPQQQPQQQQQQQAQQQWQQQNNTTPGQWGTQQQQWGQTAAQGTTTAQTNQQAYQQSQSGATTVASSDPTQAQAGTQQAAAGTQQDYSAAWALYYQQQQQYYQQYYQQQQAAGAVSSTAATSTPAAAVSTQSNDAQAQMMAQYQAQLAEYQKKYGKPQ